MNKITVVKADSDEQEGSWMNGTLSNVGNGIAVTIMVEPNVPAEIAAAGRRAVQHYLVKMLSDIDADVTLIIGRDLDRD